MCERQLISFFHFFIFSLVRKLILAEHPIDTSASPPDMPYKGVTAGWSALPYCGLTTCDQRAKSFFFCLLYQG